MDREPSENYELYNGQPPHAANSGTSQKAAEEMLGNIKTLRFKVFDFIRKNEERGATDQELQEALSLPMSTEIPRRRELVLKGFVVDSGQTRKTKSNRDAVVWCTTDRVDISEIGPPKSLRIQLTEAQAEIGSLKSVLDEEKAASKKASKFYIKENKTLKEKNAQLEVWLNQAQEDQR